MNYIFFDQRLYGIHIHLRYFPPINLPRSDLSSKPLGEPSYRHTSGFFHRILSGRREQLLARAVFFGFVVFLFFWCGLLVGVVEK